MEMLIGLGLAIALLLTLAPSTPRNFTPTKVKRDRCGFP